MFASDLEGFWAQVKRLCKTHRNAVGVLLPDALSFRLALLEGMLVLELRAHDDGGCKCLWLSIR